MALTLNATDADLPAQVLTFTKVAGPAALTVSAAGAVNWTRGEADGPGTNTVTVRVSDGTATADQTFKVVVREVNTAPVIDMPQVKDSKTLRLTLTGSSGITYRLESAMDLIHWDLVESITLTGGAKKVEPPIPTSQGGIFYRVIIR